MSLEEFVLSYFESDYTIITLLSLYGAIAALLLAFRVKKDSLTRMHLLSSISGLSLLSWAFIGSSLVLCVRLGYLYEEIGDPAASVVLGYALLAALLVASPVAALVTMKISHVVAARAGTTVVPDVEITRKAEKYAREAGLSRSVKVVQSVSEAPFAFTAGGGNCSVVISNGLVSLLDQDEMEAVLVHELAHIKNSDTQLMVLFSVYRKFLFFDPVLRFVVASLDRERDLAADEFSARITGQPLALASALLKIASCRGSGARLSVESGLFARMSGLTKSKGAKERISRLLRLADQRAAQRTDKLSRRDIDEPVRKRDSHTQSPQQEPAQKGL